jgi:hypothetical protein
MTDSEIADLLDHQVPFFKDKPFLGFNLNGDSLSISRSHEKVVVELSGGSQFMYFLFGCGFSVMGAALLINVFIDEHPIIIRLMGGIVGLFLFPTSLIALRGSFSPPSRIEIDRSTGWIELHSTPGPPWMVIRPEQISEVEIASKAARGSGNEGTPASAALSLKLSFGRTVLLCRSSPEEIDDLAKDLPKTWGPRRRRRESE